MGGWVTYLGCQPPGPSCQGEEDSPLAPLPLLDQFGEHGVEEALFLYLHPFIQHRLDHTEHFSVLFGCDRCMDGGRVGSPWVGGWVGGWVGR